MKTIIEFITIALQADTAINDWCNTYYNQLPYYSIGVAEQNAPKLVNSPMINIFPISRRRDQSQNYYIYGLGVNVAILEEGVTEATRYKKYTGIERIDEFARLVERRITKTMNAKGYASVQSDELGDVCAPPLFMAALTFTEIRVRDPLVN